MVDVLIPISVKRQSLGYVRIHRTRRMPASHRIGPIRFAPPARAVADASHWFTKLGDVRALVAEAVQKQVCSIAQIGMELEEGANRDSAYLRKALAAVRSGIRSEAEADFRDRILRSDLMAPQYNVFLRARDGTDIGEADAWWAEAGVSAEIDSQEYHFYRDGWLKTDAKHGRMPAVSKATGQPSTRSSNPQSPTGAGVPASTSSPSALPANHNRPDWDETGSGGYGSGWRYDGLNGPPLASGSSGGVRNAGAPSRSSAPSGDAAAASR
jgi:hypothetical protein